MEFSLINPDKVMKNYLEFEKSLRAFFDENLSCSKCKVEDCCCSYGSGKNAGFDHLIHSWDSYVMDRTFPQWRDIKDSEKGDRCNFLSDRGCMIPAGRPFKCTTFYCEKYDRLLRFDINSSIFTGYQPSINDSILAEYRHVAKEISIVMDARPAAPSEKTAIFFLDEYFRNAQEAIAKDGRFKVKFKYEPPITVIP